MTTIALGYTIHNYLNNNTWCESKEVSPGIRSFTVRYMGEVKPGDIILKWSDNRKHKTMWLVTDAKRKDKYHHQGRMKDLIWYREKFTERFLKAVKIAETSG